MYRGLHSYQLLLMKHLVLFILLTSTASLAQPNDNLSDRYTQMKEKAQTFKDYKVIKQTTLDAFWKQVEDSLAKQQRELSQATAEISVLKNQLSQVEVSIQRREASVSEIIFDSDHITVAGIPFHKALFISIFFVSITIVSCLLILSLFRARLLQSNLKDKSETMLVLTSEFEEYKHRAVEKQMKLSRELQNERNRISELLSHR